MSILKKGSEGPEVEKLQKRLEELGFYQGKIDGKFGPATEAAVIAFQKRRGLSTDGIVGPNTLRALEPVGEPQDIMELNINRTMRLTTDQYIAEEHAKGLIVLHHTVGGSALSTFNWWQKYDPKRIATAFIIERDGTIYEVFNFRYWAFHLGLKGTGGAHDRRSIGIEIASEGGLIEADGKLYCFDRISPRTEFTDQHYDCGYIWRGSYRYFDAYASEQIDAVIELLNYLCDTLNAPRQTPRDHLSYDPELYDFEGIIGHHHMRSDKSDIHPGFDWDRLVDECKLNLV